MEAISNIMAMTTQTLAGNKKFKYKVLERCETCGEAIKLQEPLFGKEVGATCRCFREKQEREEQARRLAEAEYERRKAKANSLMDEKAQAAVFDGLIIDDDNRRYIQAAKNYCEHWSENYKENRGLLFYGGTGRGKTTLACCIANRLTDDGINAKAMTVNSLIQRVKDRFRNNGENGETALKAEIKAASLLILDDLGAEQKTDWSTVFLYEIIDERYRSDKPTIVTTNLSLKQLREHLTDKYGVPRAFDRLVEGLTPVEFQCRNYRKEQAKVNKSDYDFFGCIK